MKITNIEAKVRSGKFFKDYTAKELIDIAKEFYSCKSIEEENKLFKHYAEALYKHINSEGTDFVVITLKECFESIKTDFKDEFIKRVIFNDVIYLPCDIGDIIYTYRYNFEDKEFEIIGRPIKDIQYSVKDSTIMISDGEFFREFGKEMFLTREEAENYLNSLLNK